MNSPKVSYLLFTLSLILISQAPMPASCQSLFEIVCKEAGENTGQENTGECLQLLKAVPQIPTAKNYFGLSKLILNLGIEKGIQSQKYFMQLAKANPKSQALNQCANFDYGGTISSFQSAVKELTEDLQTATYDAKVAGDGPVNCQELVDAEKISNPTIAEINKMMSLLSVVAFLATNHIPENNLLL